MQSFLQIAIRFIPTIALVLLLLFMQLILISVPLTSLYLYGQLIFKQKISTIIIAAFLISLVYDAIKLNPLGTWALSFFIAAALVTLVTILSRIHAPSNRTISAHIIAIILIACATMLQAFIIEKITASTRLDHIQIISIIGGAILYELYAASFHKEKGLYS